MTKNRKNTASNRPPVKKKNGRIKQDITALNIVLTVLALIANGLVWWTLLSVVRYSTLSKPIFIIINIVILFILLFMNLTIFMLVRTKRKKYLNIGAAFLVICLLLGGFGTYVTGRINKNVNKITQTGTINETVDTSLVIFDENQQFSINSIAEMNGKTLGVVKDSNYEKLALEKLTSENVTVTTTEYEDYITLAQGLFAGEVDIAALPGNYEAQLGVNDGFDEYLVNTKAVDTFSKVVEVNVEKGSDKDLTTEPFTVLIMGTAEGLSDAMMIASFNPISMRVTLTSIARDSYVPIACSSGSSKINSARGRSRQCAIDTVEQLTGIPIDYYFESNFKGIVDMVDAIGGIVVNNPYEFVGQNSSSERGHKTVWIPAGENVPLNGEQALAFARERKLYATGDFQRQANQQQVIEAILTKVMRLRDLNKALDMLDAAGDNVSTNMSVDQLISLFNYSMGKVNRSFDQEHPEKIFDIVGSRITGYNSGLWNEGLQQNIYIYRLYEGSLKDTRAGITRNIDLNSKIDAPKSVKWEATWEFYPPTLSNETYAEKVIVAEIPDNLPAYTTVGKLTAWAKSFGIAVNIQYVTEGMEGYDGNLADGTIIWQDVPAGTAASAFTQINIKVIQKNVVTKCPANSTGEYPSCVCTDTTQKYDKNKNTCAAATTGVERNITIRYVYAENGKEAAPTYTAKVVEGNTYSVSSPAIKDYTADTATVTGTMGTADVDVTVKYTKVGGGTPTPTPTVKPSCPSGSTGAYPTCVCPDGGIYDQASNTCKAPTPSCPSGSTGAYPSCVCPDGGIYDQASNTCKA
ncbi:MAG: LCP family protein, partial [Anaerorhabdus sp.]